MDVRNDECAANVKSTFTCGRFAHVENTKKKADSLTKTIDTVRLLQQGVCADYLEILMLPRLLAKRPVHVLKVRFLDGARRGLHVVYALAQRRPHALLDDLVICARKTVPSGHDVFHSMETHVRPIFFQHRSVCTYVFLFESREWFRSFRSRQCQAEE